jgi:precorrin-2 dehydrogenase
MSLFPMFLKLEGRKCLVVGAGTVAQSKIESLFQSGARVRIVAPEANEVVRQWVLDGTVTWAQRSFEPSDLKDVFLVIAATSSPEVNAAVFHEARLLKVLCNAVDDPKHCDFYYPAVVRRGKLQLAISTEGQSPALAQKLRQELEARYGPEYENWVNELGEARQQLFATKIDPEQRRRRLHELASARPASSVREDFNAR